MRFVEKIMTLLRLSYLYTGEVKFELREAIQLTEFCRRHSLPTLLEKAIAVIRDALQRFAAIKDPLEPALLFFFLQHIDELPELAN